MRIQFVNDVEATLCEFQGIFRNDIENIVSSDVARSFYIDSVLHIAQRHFAVQPNQGDMLITSPMQKRHVVRMTRLQANFFAYANCKFQLCHINKLLSVIALSELDSVKQLCLRN